MPKLFFVSLVAAVVCMVSCNGKGRSGNDDAIGRWTPSATLPPQAVLELPNTKIPVDVATKVEGDRFVVELTAFGEVLESEVYRSKPDGFALIEAFEEAYVPDVPLLGKGTGTESWKWAGTISSGGVERKATAQIFGKELPLKLVGYDGPGRLVTVELLIESGPDVRAERKLGFYFAEKAGLLKREFGLASTRVPGETPIEE